MMSWLQTQSTTQLLRAEATAFDAVDPSTLLDVYYNAQDSIYINRQGLPNTELCWRQIRGYSQTNDGFKHYIDQFNLVPTTKYPTNLYQIKSGGGGTSQVAAGIAYGPATVIPTAARPPGSDPSYGDEDELGYTTPPVYFGIPYITTVQLGGGNRMFVSDLDSQFPFWDPPQYFHTMPSINPFFPEDIPAEELLQLQMLFSAKNHIWRGKTLLASTQNSPVQQQLTGGIVSEVYKKLVAGEHIFEDLFMGYLPFPPWEYTHPLETNVLYSTRMVESVNHSFVDSIGPTTGGGPFGSIVIKTPWQYFKYNRPMKYGVQWYILGQDSDKFYGPTNETEEIELGDFPYFKVKKTPAEDVMVVIAVYIIIDTSIAQSDPDSNTGTGTKTYIVTHGIHTIGSITSSDTQLTILEAGGVVGNLSVFGYIMSQVGAPEDNSYIVVEETTGIMVYALSKVHVSIPGGEFILTGEHTKTNFTTKNIIALVVGQSSITATQTSTTTSITTTAIKYFAISGEPTNRVAEEIHLDEYKFYLFQRSNGVYKTLKEIIGAYVQIMANDSSATGTLMVSGIKITSPIGEQMPNVSEVEYHHIQIEVVVFTPSSMPPFALSLPNEHVVPPLTVDPTKDEASYDLTKLLSTVPGFVSGNFTQLGNVLGFPQLVLQPCVISLTDTFADPETTIPSTYVLDLEKPLVSVEGSVITFTKLPTSASPLPFIGKAVVSTSISSILGDFSFVLTIDPEPPAFAPVFIYANTRTTIDLQAQLVRQISDKLTIGAYRQTTDLRCSIDNHTSFPPMQLSGVGFQFLLTILPRSTLTIDENFMTATFECGDITISTTILVEIDAFAYGPTYKLNPPLILRAYLIKKPTPVVTWGPRTLLPLLFTSLATTKMFVDGTERVIRPTSRLVSDWIPVALDPANLNNFVVALPSDKLILLVDFANASAPIFEVYQCQHIVLPSTITIDMFSTNGTPQHLELSVNDPPIMPTVLVQDLCIGNSTDQTLVVPYVSQCQVSLKTVDADPNSCTIKLTIKINRLVADASTRPIYGIAPVDTTPTDITGRTTDVSVGTLCPIESFESGSASRFLGYDTINLFIKAQRDPSEFPTTSDSFIFLRQSDATYKRHPFFLAIYSPPVLKWVALGQGLAIPQNPPNIPVSINGQWISSSPSGDDDTLSDTAQGMTLVGATLTATKPTNAIVVVGSLAYNLRFFTPMSPQTTFVIAKTNLEDVSTVKTVSNIKFISRDTIPNLNNIVANISPTGDMAISIPPLQDSQTGAGAYLTKFGVLQYGYPLAESWDCIAIIDNGLPIAQTVVAISGGSTQIRIFKTYNLQYLDSSLQLLTRPYELDASRVDIDSAGGSVSKTSSGFIVKPQIPSIFNVAGTAYFESSAFPNMSSGAQPFPPVDLHFAIKVVVVPSPANTATNFYNLAGMPPSIISQLDNKPWFSMQNIGDSQVATVSNGVATYVAQPAPFYNEYIGTDTSGITTRIRLVGINIPTAYVVGETPLSTSLPISTAGSTDLFNENYAINGSTYPSKFAATLVSAPDFMSIIKSGTTWMVQFKPTQDIELTGDITFAVDQAAIKIPIEFVPEIYEAAFTVGATVNTTPKPGSYVPATFGGLLMSTSGLLTGIAAVPGTYTFWQEINTSFACLRVTILEQTAILDIYCKPSAPRDEPDTRQIFPGGSDLGDLPLPFTNAIQSNVTMLSVSLDSSGLLTWHTGTAEGNFQYSIPSQDIIINFVVANPIVYDTTTVYLNSDSIFATVDVESGCEAIVNGVVQPSSANPSEVFGQIACNYTGSSPLTITGQPPSTAVVKIGKSTITVKRWSTLMPIVHKTKGTLDTYSFGIVPASATLNVKAKWKFTTESNYGTMSILNEQDDGIGQVPYIISNSTGIFLRYGPGTSQNIDVVIRVEGNTPTSPDTIYAFSLIVSSADYLAWINSGDQYLVGGQVARMTPAQFVAMGAIPLPDNVEGLFEPYNSGYYKGQLTTRSGISKLSPDAIRYIEMPTSWQDVGNSSGNWYYIGGTLISSSDAGVISPTHGPTQAEARAGNLVVQRVDIETLRDVIPPGKSYEGAQTVPPSYIYEGVSAVPSGFIRRSAHLLETQNAIYDFSSGLVSLKTKNPISDMIEVIVQDSTYYTHYKLAVALNVMQPKPLTITYKGSQTHVDIRDYIPYTLTNIVAYDKDSVAIAYDPTVPITGEPTIYYEGTMSSGVLIRGKIEFIKKQT